MQKTIWITFHRLDIHYSWLLSCCHWHLSLAAPFSQFLSHACSALILMPIHLAILDFQEFQILYTIQHIQMQAAVACRLEGRSLL
jgi:hypothetical protein